MKLFYIFSILMALLLISCSNNTETPPEQTVTYNFLPLKVGNYWIFKYHTLDVNSNPVDSTMSIDSLVVTDFKSYLGYNSYFLTYYKNNVFMQQMIFAKDPYGIYREADSTNVFSIPLRPIWFKIEDYQNDDWTIYGQYDENQTILFDTSSYIGIKHYVFSGNKVSTVFPLDSTNIAAYVCSIKDDRKYSFDYKIDGYKYPANLDLIHTQYEHITLGLNVGFCLWQADPVVNTIRSDSSYCVYKNPQITKNPGWRRELIRYSVK